MTRKVTAYEVTPNTDPATRKLFRMVTTVILECGHRVQLGTGSTRPRLLECYQCEERPLLTE